MPYKEIFWHSVVLKCEASSPIQLKFELHWDFKPILVASKFEEDLTENEHFFFFNHSRAPNSKMTDQIWR